MDNHSEGTAQEILQRVEAADPEDQPALVAGLRAIGIELARHPSGPAHYVHGRILSLLGRDREALQEHLSAISLAPNLADAHYSAGLLLADQGREEDALSHWEKAGTLGHADARYNVGQFYRNHAQFESALRHWQAAHERLPSDFEILKKVIQAKNALGQHAAAAEDVEVLVGLWQRSTDPQVQEQDEVVIDQFRVGSSYTQAYLTLRPRNAELHYVYTFAVDSPDSQTSMTVQLESSAYGRETGMPYLLGMDTPTGHQTLGEAFASRPSYAELKPLAPAMGIVHVESGPLVRSSYRAETLLAEAATGRRILPSAVQLYGVE